MSQAIVNWRRVVVELNKDDLKRELDLVSNDFARNMDFKNEYCENLKEKYLESVKQYHMVKKNHEIHVEKLLELRKIKNQTIRKNFLKNMDRIYDEFEKEFETIIDDRVRQLKYLNDMIDFIKDEEK